MGPKWGQLLAQTGFAARLKVAACEQPAAPHACRARALASRPEVHPPTLAEAWSVSAPMFAGCTPVGVNIDETLGLIDFELKRLDHVTALPFRRRGPSTPAFRLCE